jgi:methylated-DNA-protein-cysteine methyltransferase-like protein
VSKVGVELRSRIYAVVTRVPEGTVATYGQIAELADTGPRQVGGALATLPTGTECPWHRVVNSQGRISQRSETGEAEALQQSRLEDEGVEFQNGRIDLDVYRWEG